MPERRRVEVQLHAPSSDVQSGASSTRMARNDRLKSLAADRADQFGTDAVAAQEVRRIVAGKAAIEPDQQQGGVRIEIRREGMDGIAIPHCGSASKSVGSIEKGTTRLVGIPGLPCRSACKSAANSHPKGTHLSSCDPSR